MHTFAKRVINSNRYLKTIVFLLRTIRLRKIQGSDNFISNKATAIKLRYDIIGNSNNILLDKGVFISNTEIRIRGNNNQVILESDCKYYKGSIWLEGDNCQVLIGAGTTVMDAHIFAQESKSKILIGQDCMLSNNIIIRTSDSHSIIENESKKRINHAKDISIGNHVWIAAWVRILKGSEIKDNSIIALGSIVNSSVPKNCIVAGIPAKVVKENINWSREQL